LSPNCATSPLVQYAFSEVGGAASRKELPASKVKSGRIEERSLKGKEQKKFARKACLGAMMTVFLRHAPTATPRCACGRMPMQRSYHAGFRILSCP
jgi:hypothetical protein